MTTCQDWYVPYTGSPGYFASSYPRRRLATSNTATQWTAHDAWQQIEFW